MYREKQQRAPFRISFLKWVQNFQDCGIVESQSRCWRPTMTGEDEQKVYSYFNRHPTILLRIAERLLDLP